MRNALVLVVLLMITCFQWSCRSTPSAEPAPSASLDPAVEARIDELMAGMSLADKVGEMTQVTIDVLLAREGGKVIEPQRLDPDSLQAVLVDKRVGSVLNVYGHAYPVDQWREFVRTMQEYATEKKASGIPILYGIDSNHGANYSSEGTLFPQQIGLAATWNPGLVEDLGAMAAYETRASFIPWTFSPVADIGRDPRWPRLWEGFGEDVHLSSVLSAAMTRGYQGEQLSDDPQRVLACLKHYLGYGLPFSGRDRTQAFIPERQLREYFLPPFQAAVDAGAMSVMVCSGEINGVPVHANKYLLTDVLKGELGFTGFVVSDWADIRKLRDVHKVAKDYKEAVKMAVNAGIDMGMTPYDTEFADLLAELVEEGEVTLARIDDAVRRILRTKIQLGLFEQPLGDPAGYPRMASAEHAELAYQGALESLVLLKNDDDLLPLPKTARLLVTGPTANSLIPLNGGWTYTWQGSDSTYYPKDKMTIVEALRAKLGYKNVNYAPGVGYEEDLGPGQLDIPYIAATWADAIVVCLGESSYAEKPGDLYDMDLPDVQIELVKTMARTGKPIILVLAEGRPRIFRKAEPYASAVLLAPLPGNEGGRAIADVLFGDANPSGKLPTTYPKYSNSLETYDHKHADQDGGHLDPQYEFGYGLSYTTFTYSDLQLRADELTADGQLIVSVTVTNAGRLAGKEVVQLYVSDEVASITPPVKRLRAFQKIELAPGASQTVSFELSPRDLAFVGRDLTWITEPGAFTVRIGDLSGQFSFVGEKVKY